MSTQSELNEKLIRLEQYRIKNLVLHRKPPAEVLRGIPYWGKSLYHPDIPPASDVEDRNNYAIAVLMNNIILRDFFKEEAWEPGFIFRDSGYYGLDGALTDMVSPWITFELEKIDGL